MPGEGLGGGPSLPFDRGIWKYHVIHPEILNVLWPGVIQG